MKPVLIDFPGNQEYPPAGPVDWLNFMHACNKAGALRPGAPIMFDEPVITPADRDALGVYTEQYADALVELPGDGTQGATIRSLTDRGEHLMRTAAAILGHTIVELDGESSASRQHYIDTGRYLRPGEAEEGLAEAPAANRDLVALSMSELDAELQVTIERAVAIGRRVAQSDATTLGMIVERTARALGLTR